MTFEEKLREEREQGRKEGREKVLAMNNYLLAQDRIEDLKRSCNDPEFRRKIMEEMGM